jgi:hypothetical protein
VGTILRDRLGLDAGGEVDVDEHDGVVEIRTAPRAAVLDRSQGRPVLRTDDEAPRLTDEETRDLLDHIRR